MASLISLVFSLSFFAIVVPSHESIDFLYNGFNQTNLTLDGATIIKPGGALRLTNKSSNVIGHAFYPQPIQMFTKSSSSVNSSSFSTSFVFAIVPKDVNGGGYGLAFTLSPSQQFPGAEGDHYLGIFNSTNDGNSSNHIFAVQFDTVDGHKEKSDTQGNHIGININSMTSIASKPASYNLNDGALMKEVSLESGTPIQAWIEYDGVKQEVNVTISPSPEPKPTIPLITHHINLSHFLSESVYIGFSAATGRKSSSHYILGWSFSMNGRAPELDLSRLPKPPNEGHSSSFKPQINVFLAILSIVVIFLLRV